MKEPFIPRFEERFPDWLRQHPSLQPWREGKSRLERETVSFVEQFSPKFYDSANPDQLQEGSQLCERLLSCWVYHWGRQDTGWTPEESSEHLLKCMNFQPLEDVIFSEAVYERQEVATVYFQESIGPYLRQTGRKLMEALQFSDDGNSEWLNEFWLFLLDEKNARSCVLLRYLGYIPIRNWLSVVFTHHVCHCWRKTIRQPAVVSLDEVSPQEVPDRSSVQQDELYGRFAEFLEKQLRQIVAQLDGESRLRLEYAYSEELSNQQVAAILREHPSTTSRKRMAVEENVVQKIRKALHDSEWREFDEDFAKCSASDVMKWLFGRK